MALKSLWGDLSQVAANVRTPRTILLEQAKVLTDETKGELVGSVGEGHYGENLRYSLNIKVPVLNNYLVAILAADHGVDLYPVRLVASRPPTDFMCRDEEEFEKAVGSVLSSPEIRSVISRLLSQLQ
jgi:hypothetical protein